MEGLTLPNRPSRGASGRRGCLSLNRTNGEAKGGQGTFRLCR